MYKLFAKYYDELMEQVPYNQWALYIDHIITRFGNPINQEEHSKLLVELGCGTGNMCVEMALLGYDVIGVDNSDEMLSVARDKKVINDSESLVVKPILYINQDMRFLDLYGSVDTVISVCDSLNYILEEDELKGVFEKAFYFLNPGGLFIFDLNTTFKFRHELGEATYAEQFDDYSYIWENYFDDETYINEYHLTFFVKEGNMYRKFEETHYEKSYEVNTIKFLLESAGFKVIEINGDMGEQSIDTANRHYYIAKKPQ